MYKATKLLSTILLLSAFGFTSNVIAKECYEPSPNLIDLNDEYYNLEETVELTNKQKKALNQFFRKTIGKWKGTSQHIECRGPDRAPRKIVKNAKVSAKIKLASRTQLSIDANKNYTEERIKKSGNFTLFNVHNTYSLEFPRNNTLVLSEKYRRANNYQADPKNTAAKNKKTKQVKQAKKYKSPVEKARKTQKTNSRTSRITETIYEISSSAHTLILTRFYYTSGVYIGEETWTMRAD